MHDSSKSFQLDRPSLLIYLLLEFMFSQEGPLFCSVCLVKLLVHQEIKQTLPV